jgi:hypothetical protein
LAYGLVGAFRNISCTAASYCEHEFPNVGSSHCINEFVANSREGIRSQTPQDVIGMARRLAYRPPFPPSFSYSLKAVLSFTLLRFGSPLFGFGFGLAFGHWIHTSRQRSAGSEVKVAGPG